MAAHDQVELYVACRELVNMDLGSLSDPFVVLFRKTGATWIELGKSEIVWNNLNPEFAKTFELDFEFEKRQAFKVECRDADNDKGTKYDLLGAAEFELGAVVGAKNSKVTLNLLANSKVMGKVVLRVEPISKKKELGIWNLCVWLGAEGLCVCGWDKEVISLKLRAKDMKKYILGVIAEETYFTVSRTDKARISWTKVYQSEPITSNNYACAELVLTKDKLCCGDLSTPLKVSCFLTKFTMLGSVCCSNQRYKGEFLTTAQELLNGTKDFSFANAKTGKIEGSVHAENITVREDYSFLEYMRSGLQISLVVGIDFTASNGAPNQKSSLHYFDPQHGDSLNQYQQTILSVGNVLLHYDTDKMIPVYGFGARTKFPKSSIPSNKTLHFFPCSGDFAEPAGFGVEGVFELYQHCIKHVSLDGPTYFAPLLKEIVEYTRASFARDPWAYTVLLLLTDGDIHDMQATIDIIVEGSYLPLSIVIIGVGDCNFDSMDALDSDDKVGSI